MTRQEPLEVTLWGEDKLCTEHTFYQLSPDSEPVDAGVGVKNVARALSPVIGNNPALLKSIKHPEEPNSNQTPYDHNYLLALGRCLRSQGHTHIRAEHQHYQEAGATA